MVYQVIAIDGPSASGKGTIAQKVAQVLDWSYLDSGALYRLTALCAKEKQVLLQDESSMALLAQNLSTEFKDGKIFLNGIDVTAEIRQETIGLAASSIAKLPQVRKALLQRQRDFLKNNHLVADGRDMGSVVFPDAILKIFLTASPLVRAQRRALQIHAPLEGETFKKILNDIKARDEVDQNRAIAPLQQLPDAKLLDTSEMTIEETVKKIVDWYQQIEK